MKLDLLHRSTSAPANGNRLRNAFFAVARAVIALSLIVGLGWFSYGGEFIESLFPHSTTQAAYTPSMNLWNMMALHGK